MKAKADMNCVGKTFCAFILLTVAVAMVTMDDRVSKIAGSSINLNCNNVSMVDLVSVIWKIRPRTGNYCQLAYRRDLNTTNRANCSERMDWKYSPETDSALQIRQVTLTDEGCYSCETSTSDGTFNQTHTLTVLIPPVVTLTCDSNGTALCKAAAGKPAAQVSWDPNGDPRTDLENHTNGTVTVLSIYSPRETSITCLVSHPAWNTSQSKKCQSDNGNMFLQYFAISAGLLGILFILALIFLCKLHHGRICYKSKIPESAPTHNMQNEISSGQQLPMLGLISEANLFFGKFECNHLAVSALTDEKHFCSHQLKTSCSPKDRRHRSNTLHTVSFSLCYCTLFV
ncbi:cell surface glycoprotein CD200 receptor 1-B-like isoform X2 [Malaclemys terrapin pileata]|uniref:cell surface glycoprotein CD200 receptor 1-B-like isoform X2 n=1 Tax=Malaclemys terrapin pileata TaxID=2991368 RepID=UPI0023A8EF05|nr:cell surface glycoprotein CD200 receptor 1-B-like isoform X2 [Malaclemys terrapin pileata]